MRNEKMSRYVGTQVTEKEKKQIMEAARKANVSVSQYIRRKVLGEDSETAEKDAPELEDMLTVTEFMKYLSVSRTTAMRIISECGVKHTKVHGMYRISRSSIQDLLDREMSFTKGREEESRYLTLTEASRLLKYSPQTVSSYVQSGKLKASRINKQYRFRKEDLDAFLESTEINGITQS